MKVSYKDMVLRARKEDLGEEVMINSIKNVECLLDSVLETNPELYWNFIRSEQENMFGNHYSEEFALLDVSKMFHTDPDGEVIKGEYWSMTQAEKVARDNKLGTSRAADVYVALNAFYHDKINMEKAWYRKELQDEDLTEEELEERITKIAEARIILDTINFWFKDEDAPDGKIWLYMRAMNK